MTRDAFDDFAAPKPEPAKPVSKGHNRTEQASYRKAHVGRYVVFDHPKHGKVAGQCVEAEYAGISQPGDVPNYRLTIRGLNRTRRNEIVVDSSTYGQRTYPVFFDTEKEAVAECGGGRPT